MERFFSKNNLPVKNLRFLKGFAERFKNRRFLIAAVFCSAKNLLFLLKPKIGSFASQSL
jgi:hypothetical protein